MNQKEFDELKEMSGSTGLLSAQTFLIDQNHLDVEWSKQSAAVFEACRLAAQAQLCFSDYKRQLDVKKAEASTDIRRNPDRYGFNVKPTEGAIEAQITALPVIQDLQDKIIHAKYQYELCNAAVTALDNKKKGLESLTRLRAMNYYAAK